MTVITPPITNLVSIGEDSTSPDVLPAVIATFFKPEATINVNQIGVYFKGFGNQGANLQMQAFILLFDITDIVNAGLSESIILRNLQTLPPTPPIVLTDFVDLSGLLKGVEGWKWIPINPTIFDKDRFYLIAFMVAGNEVPNGIADTIQIGATEKYIWGPPEQTSQDYIFFERVQQNPIAIGISDGVMEQPQLEMLPLLILLLIGGGIGAYLLLKK